MYYILMTICAFGLGIAVGLFISAQMDRKELKIQEAIIQTKKAKRHQKYLERKQRKVSEVKE